MVRIKPLPGIIFSETPQVKESIESYQKNLLKQALGLERNNFFGKYLEENSLIKHEPSVYLYSITFDFPSRYGSKRTEKHTLRGFVTLMHRDDLIRHENRDQKHERKILDSFKENRFVMAPVMAMFNDKGRIISRLHQIKRKEELLVNATSALSDPADSRHSLSRITDRNLISKLSRDLHGVKKVIIADGHHRFEALKNIGSEWIPVFLVDMNDSSLVLMSWHRALRIKDPLSMRNALEDIFAGKRFTTHLYKAGSIDDIRKATHPSEFGTGVTLKLKRRMLLSEDDEIPPSARDLGIRPIGGRMAEFKTPEVLISTSPGKNWFVYWMRAEGVSERELGRIRFFSREKLLLFGLYAAPKKHGIRARKYYLLGTTADLPTFLKLLDDTIKKKNYGARITFQNHISAAQSLVDSGKFHAAVFVPVLRKQEVIDIAESKQYEVLPAKFTCFLPKPGAGVLMVQTDDLGW